MKVGLTQVSSMNSPTILSIMRESKQLVRVSWRDMVRTGQRRRALNVDLLEHLLQELPSLPGVQLIPGRELLAGSLLQGRDHVDAPPRSLPVDIVGFTSLGLEGRLVSSSDVLDETRDELFRHIHQVVVVGIRPVELARRELGVVGKVNALISELATNLVDTLQATDNQHLEVQLRSNTHEQVHVQLIVMGDERLGRRTTGDSVHHGRLDLGEIAVIKEVPDVLDNLGTGDENVARGVVHDQIQVPLAVTRLLVSETVEIGRQRVQARRQKDDIRRENRQFTALAILGVTAAGETDDTNDITSPEMFMGGFKLSITGMVLGLGQHLYSGTLRADIVEDQLGARRTLGVNAAGDLDLDVRLLLALGEALMVLQVLTQIIGDVELVRVGIRLLGLAELVDLSTPDLEILLGVSVLTHPIENTRQSKLTWASKLASSSSAETAFLGLGGAVVPFSFFLASLSRFF